MPRNDISVALSAGTRIGPSRPFVLVRLLSQGPHALLARDLLNRFAVLLDGPNLILVHC
jgi:hypothetical protein